MEEYIIQRALPSDAEKIAEMEKLYFSAPWSQATVLYSINDEDTLFYTAKINQRLIGYISGKLIAGETDIGNLAVDEAYRKKGIGKALLQALITQTKQHGGEAVTLEVRKSNLPAIALYEKAGFVLLGVRPNYYTNPKEDACIYLIHL